MLESVQEFIKDYPIIYDNLKFVGVLLLAFLGYEITRKVILRGVKKIVAKTKTQYDDILFNDILLRRASYIVPLIIFHEFAFLIPEVTEILNRFTESIIALIILLIISAALNALVELYSKSERFKKRPIKGYVQVVKIIVFIIGGIFMVGLLTGQEPWALFAGIGTLSAVLLLIFKDTILSLVASIQISSYDLVEEGDWISVPSYGADGDVIDISLNVVKIQNWDKTISVIPTYKLIDSTFKNWRGMSESGGRRIKRSVHIDQNSIKFCTSEMLEKFKKFELIKNYISEKQTEVEKYNKESGIDSSQIINGRRLTNLGTFRAYLREYLQKNQEINNGMTFLVRQLPPDPMGLPIEIYVFTKTTEWDAYEDIQSDIFDHLLAVVDEFELKLFQSPTGNDIQNIKMNNPS